MSALVNADSVRLSLGNTGAESAHFTIYSYGQRRVAPTHVDVRGHHEEVVELDAKGYDLSVHAANRFRYDLTGARDSARVDVAAGGASESGELRIVIANREPDDVAVDLQPLRFSDVVARVFVGAGETTTINWLTDEGGTTSR